jgi:hypothetical protein
MMRIQYRMEGGLAYFPGLSKSFTVDSAALPDDAAKRLQQLVDNTNFFERPEIEGKQHPGAADIRNYVVTVKDGKRSHTVRLADPVTDTDMQALIDYLNHVRPA